MKFANGYGSITKLAGNRRNPYWVRSAAIKYVEDGKVKTKRQTIGYYKTQKEAVNALAYYNENPYSLDNITVSELWDKTKDKMKISESRYVALGHTFEKYFISIANRPIREIRTDDLQDIIDNCTARSSTKDNIKTIMNQLYKRAMANDYVSKNYAQYVSYEKDETQMQRDVFTSEEISKLWKRAGRYEYDFMLVLLYTGCRFSEIADNTPDNIDFENLTLTIPEEIAKNKQSARTIPIHNKIVPLLKAHIGTKYAFEHDGYKVEYKNLHGRHLGEINEYIGSSHRFHDTRHTFTTVLKENGVDLFYIDELIGHKHNNITEDTYSHARMEKLREALNKLDYDSVTNV